MTEEDQNMGEDNYDQCMRIVGGINALSELAKVTQCMRLDKRTVDLMETARAALNKAVLSAWEYADSQSDASPEHLKGSDDRGEGRP
jgi:hypothetical protein